MKNRKTILTIVGSLMSVVVLIAAYTTYMHAQSDQNTAEIVRPEASTDPVPVQAEIAQPSLPRPDMPESLDALDDITLIKYALKALNAEGDDDQVVGKTIIGTGIPVESQGKTYNTKNTTAVTVSGMSPNGSRYIAMIETAQIVDEEADKDGFVGMEFNSFQCSLISLEKRASAWKIEFFDVVDKTENTGGTRAAHSCGSGYLLTWDSNERPKLIGDEGVTGPYIGGNYSKAVSTISWKNGKYVMDTEIIAEGDFDTVAKAKSPYAKLRKSHARQ
jgi:hypothetical protein